MRTPDRHPDGPRRFGLRLHAFAGINSSPERRHLWRFIISVIFADSAFSHHRHSGITPLCETSLTPKGVAMPKDDPDALNRAYNQSKQQMDSGRHPSNPGAFGNSTANPAGSSRHSSSGPKPCFPAGTFVQTPGGAEDIAHLEAGDLVSAVDPNGHVSHRRVLRKVRHSSARLWRLRFSDGSQVLTTAGHSFAVDGGWRCADSLKIGERLESHGANGSYRRTIETSGFTDQYAPVFNLIVEGNFTFVADSAIVHSFTNFRMIRVCAWTLYDAMTGWGRAFALFEH